MAVAAGARWASVQRLRVGPRDQRADDAWAWYPLSSARRPVRPGRLRADRVRRASCERFRPASRRRPAGPVIAGRAVRLAAACRRCADPGVPQGASRFAVSSFLGGRGPRSASARGGGRLGRAASSSGPLGQRGHARRSRASGGTVAAAKRNSRSAHVMRALRTSLRLRVKLGAGHPFAWPRFPLVFRRWRGDCPWLASRLKTAWKRSRIASNWCSSGARRAKQLLKGARPLVESDNKEVVTALREIAAGEVTLEYPRIPPLA